MHEEERAHEKEQAKEVSVHRHRRIALGHIKRKHLLHRVLQGDFEIFRAHGISKFALGKRHSLARPDIHIEEHPNQPVLLEPKKSSQNTLYEMASL